MARSSGMVVHPLAAGRSPTDDIFFSLGLLDRESEPFLFASPWGREGVKQITAGDG